MGANQVSGHVGELRAANFLVERGFAIIERNYRCRWGEADIVVWDGARVGFVEVKARSNTSFGSPAEAIGRDKLRRMQRVAEAWSRERKQVMPIWLGVVTILGESAPELITEIEAID